MEFNLKARCPIPHAPISIWPGYLACIPLPTKGTSSLSTAEVSRRHRWHTVSISGNCGPLAIDIRENNHSDSGADARHSLIVMLIDTPSTHIVNVQALCGMHNTSTRLVLVVMGATGPTYRGTPFGPSRMRTNMHASTRTKDIPCSWLFTSWISSTYQLGWFFPMPAI